MLQLTKQQQIDEERKRNEICTLTGLSDVMIKLYILMKDRHFTDKLEVVMWPNKNIKSLGKKAIEKFYPMFEKMKEENRQKLKNRNSYKNKTTAKDNEESLSGGDDEGGGADEDNAPLDYSNEKRSSSLRKAPKKPNDDDVRKFIITQREKEISALSEKEIDEKISEIRNFCNTQDGNTPIHLDKNNNNNTTSIDDNNKGKPQPSPRNKKKEEGGSNFSYPWSYNERHASTMMDDKLIHNNEHSAKLNASNEKKDAMLMFDYVGWGVTKSGFVVFVYYTGPENKGANYHELFQASNCKIVPKNHLSHFHKQANSYYKSYLSHTNYCHKQSKFIKEHVRYDTRNFINKWQGKEHHERIMANKHLFTSVLPSMSPTMSSSSSSSSITTPNTSILPTTQASKPEYYIQVIQNNMKKEDEKKRKQQEEEEEEEDDENIPNSSTSSLRSSYISEDMPNSKPLHQYHHNRSFDDIEESPLSSTTMFHKNDETGKEHIGGVKDPYFIKKLIGVNINNNVDLTTHPIDKDIEFTTESFFHLLDRIQENPKYPPSHYTWKPIELVKAFAISSHMDLQARNLLSNISENYNISFDNQDSSHMADAILSDSDVQFDVKRTSEQYVLATLMMDYATRDEYIFPIPNTKPYELLAGDIVFPSK
jgi:hypothetical protein